MNEQCLYVQQVTVNLLVSDHQKMLLSRFLQCFYTHFFFTVSTFLVTSELFTAAFTSPSELNTTRLCSVVN
jgi:hypothetical protein